MPELPEVEALRRALDDPVRAFPVEKAGPAHTATLKTYDPPLTALEGRRFAGAERRGKHLLFPTEDGELVLHMHQMSAGRIRYLAAGATGPKKPAFRLPFHGGGALVLTEAGAKKRARVGLYHPKAIAAELADLGPEARRSMQRLRRSDRARGLRRAHDLLLPAVSDRRAGSEGSPAVAATAVAARAGGRRRARPRPRAPRRAGRPRRPAARAAPRRGAPARSTPSAGRSSRWARRRRLRPNRDHRGGVQPARAGRPRGAPAPRRP